MIRPPAEVRRIVYLGTPDAAVPPLRALAGAGFDIALVITRADKRRGRRGGLTPSPIKRAAIELGLPVEHDVAAALDVGADLGVVVAFGRIIRPEILAELAMVNVHFSLLPRWRGAAPVERAILAGDPTTGVCLMEVAEGLDTGAVYRRLETPVHAGERSVDLTGRLARLGAGLLVRSLGEGLGEPTAQVGDPTYAEKITPDELELDFTRAARDLMRTVQVGGAWTMVGDQRIKVHDAAAVDASDLAPGQLATTTVGTAIGGLELITVQPAGKKPMTASDWVRGARLGAGAMLGSGSSS